jgi:hypothetical protein
MTEAETLFNETFRRWIYTMSVISNFKTTFVAVAPKANEHLQKYTANLFKSLFEDPMYEGLLVDIDPNKTTKPKPTTADYAKLGETAAAEILKTSYASLDGAVLVFYHSLLDGLVFDCCRVSALHAPRDWEQDLKTTTIPLLDTKEKSYDQLLQAKINDRLWRLERESLFMKLDRLYARCNPPPGWSPMKGYTYDKDLLVRFDEQRHDIVHGKALGQTPTKFPATDNNLAYIHRTGLYFLGLMNFKYGFQFDPTTLSNKGTSN